MARAPRYRNERSACLSDEAMVRCGRASPALRSLDCGQLDAALKIRRQAVESGQTLIALRCKPEPKS
jgi:hypothetical protein